MYLNVIYSWGRTCSYMEPGASF